MTDNDVPVAWSVSTPVARLVGIAVVTSFIGESS